jgi:hypothetical protein
VFPVAFGAAVFWGALQARRATESERRAAASALRSDSLEAVADTTRMIVIRGMNKIFERRVVQERQRADSVDRLLRRERIARVGVEVRVRAMDTIISGHVQADAQDSIRSAQVGPVYQPPYTVAIHAALPRPPAEAVFRIAVALDSIPLHLRLGCGDARQDGIRQATASVEAPAWASIRLHTVSQSPDLCASPALQKKPKRRWPWLVAGLVVGAIGWEAIR